MRHCREILGSSLKGSGSRCYVDAPAKAKGILSWLKERLTQGRNGIPFPEQMVPSSPGKCLCPWKSELACVSVQGTQKLNRPLPLGYKSLKQCFLRRFVFPCPSACGSSLSCLCSSSSATHPRQNCCCSPSAKLLPSHHWIFSNVQCN